MRDLILVLPDARLKEAYLEMAREYDQAGEARDDHHRALQDFEAYLQRVEDYARGENLPQGYVPSDTFWLLLDQERLAGETHLRHWLTPALEIEGGHIGYTIRPSLRRQGYGTRALTLTLEKARQLGLQRVLVTCDHDNTGSARIIEKNGGVLSGSGVSPRTGAEVLRYWIDL